MGNIKKQIKSEIKQLPFMLGKLTGGAMAVIGFPGMIIVITRKSNPSFLNILPYLALGIFGVFIFLLSSRLFEKRMNESNEFVPGKKEKINMSIISWGIFLALIAIFILITFIMTKL